MTTSLPDPSHEADPSWSSLTDRVWDAAIVGAGPAGALLAYELGKLGISALLLERQAFPRWKVCGTCLSPGAVELLGEVGLGSLLGSLRAVPLHTLWVGGWGLRAEVLLRGSVSISRGAFDAGLVTAAERGGAVFLPRARVRLGYLSDGMRKLEVSLPGKRLEVSARVVVAADGLVSGLMAEAGVPSTVPRGRWGPRIGLGGVFERPGPDFRPGVIHMAVGRGGYVGLVRVEGGALNVAAALSPGLLSGSGKADEVVASLLHEAGFPALPGIPNGGWKGTPELTRRPARLGAERLFAVGDAAGYVEPFTGEGMFWALVGAQALAPLVRRGIEGWHPGLLAEWEAAYRLRFGWAQRRCRGMAWVLRKPVLSRLALGVLRRFPAFAAPVMGRIGFLSPASRKSLA